MSVENYRIGRILVERRIRSKNQVVEALRTQTALKKQKKKEPQLRVPHLCEILDVPEEEKAEALDIQEMYRAMEPRLPYPETDTTFGKSLLHCMKDKCAVALYATENHLFINDEDTLFLSDGSHCYYLFLAILWRCMNISIITNNVGVVGEYTMQRGKIGNFTFLPNGFVDPELGGVFRFEEEEEEALRHRMENTNTFISVHALDSHNGPGCGAPRDQIRRLAIQSGSKVTILCDYLDLCQREGSFAPILRGEHINTWRSWLDNGESYIITTAHPKTPPDKLALRPDLRGPFNIPENDSNKNRNPWQLYLYNACQLYNDMRERFVEVDLDGKKLSYNR